MLPTFDNFPPAERPTLIVMSVGHSGSTPVAKALALCGWLYADRNHHWDRRCEVSRVGLLNTAIIDQLRGEAGPDVPRMHWLIDGMVSELNRLPIGFVVKDPRWCLTLDQIPHWADKEASALVWLHRNMDDVKQSFLNRSETVERNGQLVPGEFGRSVDEMNGACEFQYESWPYRKWIVSFGQVLAAVDDGSRKEFVEALGIEEFGPFARESVELAMSLFSPALMDTSVRRERTSGWDASGKFTQGE